MAEDSLLIFEVQHCVELRVFRVPTSDSSDQQYHLRAAFRDTEFERRTERVGKGVKLRNGVLSYVVTHSMADYDSIQGGWDVLCEMRDKPKPARSTDPNFLQLRNKLLPIKDFQNMEEFFAHIGYDPATNTYSADSNAAIALTLGAPE